MRYLFFDIECADGNRAICEFGYVLCDEHFRIIRQRNILINPECEFNLRNRPGQADLELTYPYEEYYKHSNFDDCYDNIKFLMSQKDLMIFGHSVDNDIRYIIKDCSRYKLDKFDFTAYDVQQMLPIFDKTNRRYVSLEKAFINIVPQEIRKNLLDHRAVDDAMKTLLVFKSMVLDLEFTPNELIESCPKCSITAIEYWERLKEKKKIKKDNLIKRQLARENVKTWKDFCDSYATRLEEEYSIGKLVSISHLVRNDSAYLNKLIKVVKENDLVPYTFFRGADYIIVSNDEERNHILDELKEPFPGKLLTIDEFANLFGDK